MEGKVKHMNMTLIKRNTLLVAICLALSLSWLGCKKSEPIIKARTPPSGPVELKLKWPVGSRMVQNLDLKQTSETQVPGMPNPMKQDMTMGQRYARSVLKVRCLRTFRSCRGLALEEVDGGIMENITINNLTMMDVAGYPIYITTGNRNRGPNVTTASWMKNIFISNVIATGIEPMSGIQITGLPEQPIEGVRLDNIRLVFNGGGTKENAARVPPEFKNVSGRYPEPSRVGVMPGYGLFARHVRGLELANIQTSFVKEDLRPAIVCA